MVSGKTILRACPASCGVLFDQPQVVESADPELVSTELSQRCKLVAGNFFEAVPGDGDAYIMKVVLHDWDDSSSIDILGTCRQAMTPAATLIVIERVIGPPNEMPEGKFSDLNMMVQYGARERTRQEFDDILKSSGFNTIDVIPTRSPLSVIIAQPISTE